MANMENADDFRLMFYREINLVSVVTFSMQEKADFLPEEPRRVGNRAPSRHFLGRPHRIDDPVEPLLALFEGLSFCRL